MEIDDKLNIIINDIKKIVNEIYPDIIDDRNLNEQLDSFSLIELMIKIESFFKINFSAEEFNKENFSTYLTLAIFIKNKKCI